MATIIASTDAFKGDRAIAAFTVEESVGFLSLTLVDSCCKGIVACQECLPLVLDNWSNEQVV
jgi:hypothetical protein